MGSDVYDDISLEDSLSLPEKDYLHAAHVMLYAKWPGALFDKYPFKYAVMVGGVRIVSLTRLSHSQERVWYVTVQLIVLADSGCRVYTRSHSTQTTYMFGGKHPTKAPHESRGSGTNRCIVHVKYTRPFPEKGCGPRD